ncbi:Phosphatidylethanolamine-binding protein [Gracilaria domingensis]|nr:Phosphatidylethanolamine-binding protein [Gracilaria domingensis]
MDDENAPPLRPLTRHPLLLPSERIPLAPPHTDHNASTPSAYESPTPPSSPSPSADYPYGAVARVVSVSPDPDDYRGRRTLRVSDPLQAVHMITDSSQSECSAGPYLDQSQREFSQLRQRIADTTILGIAIFVVTGIVFLIMTTGFTAMVANQNSPRLQIFSAWPDGGVIPLEYGCHAPDGVPISIPLSWQDVPLSATNLVILFSHPGALHESGTDPVHWFVTDIPIGPGQSNSIPANASINPDLLPHGAVQRANVFSHEGYFWPPCSNATSVFTIHAYAVEAPAVLERIDDAREIMMRFDGVPFAKLRGTYSHAAPAASQDHPDDQVHDAHSEPTSSGHGPAPKH